MPLVSDNCFLYGFNKVGLNLGGFSQKTVEWQQAEEGYQYAVPQGCIVRNTFLEWEEGEVENTRGMTAGKKPAGPSHQERCGRSLHRCRSCPAETLLLHCDHTAIYIDQPLDICSTRYSRAGDLQYDETAPSPIQVPGKAFSDHSLTVEARWPNCSDVNESGTSGSAANDEDFAEGRRFIDENISCSKNLNHEDSTNGPWKSRSPKVSRRDSQGKGRDTWSMQTSANASSMVLRGLPFQLSVADLMQFLEEAGVTKYELEGDRPCALLQNQQGRPSGFAEIQLASGVDFWDVRQKVHMQRLRGRYIEALPPRDAKGAGKPSSRQGGSRAHGSWRR